MRRPSLCGGGAFTLVEVLVAMAVSAMVGLMVFLFLNSGMVLYAKNTAVNSAHQQARSGIDQMLAYLHASVSIPELTDTNLQQVAEVDGSGNAVPAAGLSFQSFYAGPYPVVVNASATDTSVTLYCPGFSATSNTRLNIPSHDIEYDINSTTVVGSNLKFNLATPASGIGTAITISGTGIDGGAGTTYVITAFITRRMSYAVVGGELRFYPTNTLASYKVITRNVITPQPFTIPVLPTGGLQNRFVAAVNLSTVEPQFTNRGYAAVNMFVSSLIPFRCRLTNSQ